LLSYTDQDHHASSYRAGCTLVNSYRGFAYTLNDNSHESGKFLEKYFL